MERLSTDECPVNREMFSSDKKVATSSSLDIGFIMTSSNENVLKVEDDVYLDVKGKGSSVINFKNSRWTLELFLESNRKR